MFARLLTVKLGPNQHNIAENLSHRWYAAVSTLPGFIDVNFLADHELGEYGYISYWETIEDANSAGGDVGPQLTEAIKKYSKGSPRIRVYEVIEPRQTSEESPGSP